MTKNRRYDVVVHDFHGLWTHHPHRAIRAFSRAWSRVVSGDRLGKELLLSVLDRPQSQTLRQRVVEIAQMQGHTELVGTWLGMALSEEYETTYIPNWGVRRLVRELDQLEVQQLLLTNGDLARVRPIVESWGLAKYLVGMYGKENTPQTPFDRPKPRLDLQMLLRHAGISADPSRVVVVGDYWDDLLTARNNQMDSAILVVGSEQMYPIDLVEIGVRPDYLLLDPLELLSVVAGTDLGWKSRFEAMVKVGLATKITRIWEWKDTSS